MADGPAPTPDVSVVVPTRDPGPRLARCLAALDGQAAAPLTLEVLVVDDGSRRVAAVAEALLPFPRARLIRQARRGVAAARNTGAREARGPIVCFTDDDCEAEPEWVARLAGRIRGGTDAGGGLTRTGRPENPYDSATQVIVNALAQGTGARPAFLPGSNLACTREVLLAVPFDERFEGAGEDREWCARLTRLGYSVKWEETAVVHHHQNLDFQSFWRKHLRYGRGAYRFMRSQQSAMPLGPLARYRKIATTALARGPQVGLLACVAQVATAIGFVQELERDWAARVAMLTLQRPPRTRSSVRRPNAGERHEVD